MFKVMLAGKVESLETVKYPVYTSPKLDGVRAYVKGGVVYSRANLPIPNSDVQRYLGHPDFEGFDGELIVGIPTAHSVCDVTRSYVMSFEKPLMISYELENTTAKNCLRFYVFDCFTYQFDFAKRYAALVRRVAALERHPHRAAIRLVQHEIAACSENLEYVESTLVSQGYEGIMLNSPDGLYKQGRATTRGGELLKWKRFEDGEARIIGIEELMHNANEATQSATGRSKRSSHKANMVSTGRLGAFIVVDLKTGVRFNVGTGLTDAQRVDLWLRGGALGEVIKYRHQPYGAKDKPRIPTFVGFRDLRDM